MVGINWNILPFLSFFLSFTFGYSYSMLQKLHVHNLPVVVEMSLRTEYLKYSSHVFANPGETA